MTKDRIDVSKEASDRRAKAAAEKDAKLKRTASSVKSLGCAIALAGLAAILIGMCFAAA